MRRYRYVIFAALFAGGFIYLTTTRDWNLDRVLSAGNSAAPPAKPTRTGLTPEEAQNIDIYKSAHDATVHITSTVYQRGFFMEIYPARESGSGFIVRPEGLILSNNHVVSGRAREITVTLPDEKHTQLTATVVARDPGNDLALLKVTPRSQLPYLNLGDSDHLQVGQKVLAIGNPFGLEGTLTTGVVSSIGRSIQDDSGRVLE